MEYILSIDQSTSGTKAILFEPDGKIVKRKDVAHRQITNAVGWVEHDPMEILNGVYESCRQLLEDIPNPNIKAVGISNQRETAVCWDILTGKPVYNAIVWQCGRAASITDSLTHKSEDIRKITGLKLSPFFSAAKFAWILQNIPEAKNLAQQNRLCCGTIDSWLLYNLTSEKVFKTDYSNASRTQLMNLDTLKWDETIADDFGISISMLPEICYSDSVFGHTSLNGIFPYEVPICAVLGDSHAALYANGCHTENTAKATFGTGSSVMMNVGKKRLSNPSKGIVESLAWGINGQVDYVLEGNINCSGAIIRWLVDLGLIENSKQSGKIASTVDDTNGVYLVPAFSGLGAPYWLNDARAIMYGMSLSTGREEIVRAGEEAIVYQVKDIVVELNAGRFDGLSSLCVDGGPTNDSFLMEFLSGILDMEINISKTEELSAAGVAYLASISSGCATKNEIFSKSHHTKIRHQIEPQKRSKLYGGWKDAVTMLLDKGVQR